MICYCHENLRFLKGLLNIVSALIILTFVIIAFMLRASTARLIVIILEILIPGVILRKRLLIIVLGILLLIIILGILISIAVLRTEIILGELRLKLGIETGLLGVGLIRLLREVSRIEIIVRVSRVEVSRLRIMGKSKIISRSRRVVWLELRRIDRLRIKDCRIRLPRTVSISRF